MSCKISGTSASVAGRILSVGHFRSKAPQGYTCTNCRWMELNMFPKPEVSKEMEKHVCVRLYTDGNW
jgi:hypothetical protein